MVGIVILNYNNAGYTLDCIESILKFNTAAVTIVVVDNASTDGNVGKMRSLFYVSFLKRSLLNN